MDNRGSRAHRNDFQTHVDEEVVSMQLDDMKALDEEKAEETRALNAIASLNDHPGWIQIRQAFQKKIDGYRSGKILSAALLDAELSNAAIGELTRTTNLVATELETLLTTVEGAVIAKSEEDADGRTKRSKRKGL